MRGGKIPGWGEAAPQALDGYAVVDNTAGANRPIGICPFGLLYHNDVQMSRKVQFARSHDMNVLKKLRESITAGHSQRLLGFISNVFFP